MIVIIDYGVGNINSIKNMLKKIGVESKISSSVDDIRSADKLILPGVGNFGYGMDQLNKSGLVEVLNQCVLEKKVPILGICLGAQLLTNGSEEAPGVPGLGWIKGDVKEFKFESNNTLKVPHMGWADISVEKKSGLFNAENDELRYYFVHKYHMENIAESEVLTKATYGYDFVCGIEKENIIGVQFHPEKSHRFGKELLSNFAKNY